MKGRKKQRTQLITGIDIGSTAIRVAVGQYAGDDSLDSLQLVGAIEVPAEGVQKGIVTSIDEAVSSLSNALEQTERLIGVPIEHAWISISGTHIVSAESKGVVAVAKSDGEISQEDVIRTVDAARTVVTPLNYEILHVLPRHFGVDGQTNIKDPVGMTGVRLEVDTHIIYGVAAHIKNVTKAVYRTGIDIDDLVLSILATGDVVTTARQRELGVAVVNIGGPTTSLIIYEGGDVLHVAVLPIGSEHITNDIAIGLKTSIDVAERVKMNYGQAIAKAISKKQMIDLLEFGASEHEDVSLYYVSQIIEARAREILEKINAEFDSLGRRGLLPAGVVFDGGGAKLGGLIGLAKDELSLPASLGYPIDMYGLAEKGHDVAFAPAIGLVRWGSHVVQGASGTHGSHRRSSLTSATKALGAVQSFWKSLIP